jgi:hypothetical protein
MSDVLVTDGNQAPIVFRTKDLEVLFVDGGSSYLLITFNEAGKPGDGRHIWGESLVRPFGRHHNPRFYDPFRELVPGSRHA